MDIYIVKPGDNVDTIAAIFGISVTKLAADNQLTYPYPFAIGQALLILYDYEETGDYPLVANGYAYPFIDQIVLEETLPFLTEISVFSYGFTTEGYLIPPQIDDSRILNFAIPANISPILTLTPFDEAGNFNNNYIHILVNNQETINTLINELLWIMGQKGYKGVDIDFEFILPEDRIPFATFVEKTRIAMNEKGYTVSVALAPKTSADQPGLLYEGKDYKLLGEAANSVLLMTYEWGYTYGPPMAVAPLPNVRKVVDYAITEIPVEKISLGIPNYGYDWPLPYERGVTAARTIGNIEAIEIAIRYGAQIQYDETSQAPHFNYIDENSIQHEVWFEDIRSMSAKFSLIKEYNLRGCGYWQLMRLFKSNWLLLNHQFDIL